MSDQNIQRLMVAIEANTRSYERAMKKVESTTNKSFGMAEQKVKRFKTSVQGGGFAVANLGAQFNDIGVMLAAGQSPLQLALQQGTQIGQVFTQAGGSVRDAGNLMRGALASVLSPVNLLTIGVIAGGAALVQWGMSAAGASEEAGELQKRIDQAQESSVKLGQELRQLSLGVSSDELAILDGIAEQTLVLASAQAQLEAASGRSKRGAANRLAAEQANLDELNGQLDTLQQQLQAKETLKRVVAETADAERLLGQQMADTTANAREANQVAELLRAGVSATTIEAIQLSGVDLTTGILSASDAANILELGLSDSQLAAIELSNTNLAAPIAAAANEAARLAENMFLASRLGLREDLRDEDALFSQSVIPDASERAKQRQANANFERLTRPKKIRKTTSKRSPAQRDAARKAKELQREQEAIDELIASLETEASLIGASSVQREISNNLRRLGASATDEQIAKVIQLTETINREQEAWQAAKDAQDFFANSTGDALIGILDGSQSAEDAIKNLTRSIAQAALQATLLGTGPLAGIFGTAGGGAGGGGGLLGSLFGGFLGRAGGGMVSGSRPYMVGERGPELFIPNTAGKVVANQNTGSATRVVVTVDGDGNITPFVEGAVSRGIQPMQTQMRASQKTEGKRIAAHNRDAQVRKLRA